MKDLSQEFVDTAQLSLDLLWAYSYSFIAEGEIKVQIRQGSGKETDILRAGKSLRIMGVDPGSQATGYALLEIQPTGRRELRFVAKNVGVIRPQTQEFSCRLRDIGQDFKALLEQHDPHIVVLEKIFLSKNVDSAFKLGHARGILMYEAARRELRLEELATRVAKKLVSGSGAADKLQVRASLQYLLKIPAPVFDSLPLDASDALALAYGFAELFRSHWISQRAEPTC